MVPPLAFPLLEVVPLSVSPERWLFVTAASDGGNTKEKIRRA
jgi:hypothetical protein